MVASLCGPGKEILSLRLHSMQNSLTNEELYEAIERVMVTVVNQVGSVSFSCNGVLFLVVTTCSIPISAATGCFKLVLSIFISLLKFVMSLPKNSIRDLSISSIMNRYKRFH